MWGERKKHILDSILGVGLDHRYVLGFFESLKSSPPALLGGLKPPQKSNQFPIFLNTF